MLTGTRTADITSVDGEAPQNNTGNGTARTANPAGNGYGWGQKLVWLSNGLALLFFLFPFAHHAGLIENKMLLMILSKFMIAFAYIAIGICAVGFSLLYQSTQPVEK